MILPNPAEATVSIEDLIKIKYVEEHQSGVRYKRRVPTNVKADIGKTWFVKNFPAGIPEIEVIREVAHLTIKHTAMINEKRNRPLTPQERLNIEFDAYLWSESTEEEIHEMVTKCFQQDRRENSLNAVDQAFVAAVKNKGVIPPWGPILSVAAKEDTKRYGKRRNPRPFDYAIDLYVKNMGDMKVTEITRDHVVTYIGMNSHLAPSTLIRSVSTLRGLLKRCFRDQGLDLKNVFADHHIEGSGASNEDKLPFHRNHLALIDNHLTTNSRLGYETKNIIRIMKLTGGGPAEIGGLSLADIDLDAAVPYIWIRENGIRPLKNASRDRKIPLVGDALDAIMDALSHTVDRALGEKPEDVQLFKAYGLQGRGADSISQNVNAAIRRAGVPKSTRLTAYSYRHGLIEALKEADTAPTVQNRLVGHTGQGVGSKLYGAKRGKMVDLRKALVAAIPHLGDIDRANYTSDEWVD